MVLDRILKYKLGGGGGFVILIRFYQTFTRHATPNMNLIQKVKVRLIVILNCAPPISNLK
jgi:hypothetical protein